MTTQEFSNMFDTLLNSYQTQAAFGEASSKADIVLDEYEKSVLLTQAQDIIVKSFFEKGGNQQGEGFDDSMRRQVDFSSLITVKEPAAVAAVDAPVGGYQPPATGEEVNNDNTVNTEDHTNTSPNTQYPKPAAAPPNTGFIEDPGTSFNPGHTENPTNPTDPSNPGHTENPTNPTDPSNPTNPGYNKNTNGAICFDERGKLFALPKDLLIILNEKVLVNGSQKAQVVVPINYREYDRQMSKAYNQPLKKQCWRLFQREANSNLGTTAELIPNEGTTISKYRIRYIRRPRPIILVNLDFEDQEKLEIDGKRTISECELNPILHGEILNKAVELAIATRRGGSRQSGNNIQQMVGNNK